MGFWDNDDGSEIDQTDGTFDAGGGNMDPIPDGSSVLAMPDEAKWAEDRDGNEHISIRWTVARPEEFANRKIWQKLWVSDDKPRSKDPSKDREKAKRMLMAIDKNAGGKLSRKPGRPSDEDLALALISKPMVIRVGVWDMDGKRGNWVQACSPKDHELKTGTTKPSGNGGGSLSGKRPKPDFNDDLDDDVPFISMNGMF